MNKRDAWFFRVKAANRDLVEMCGGIARAAEIAELSSAQIGRCANIESDDLLSARAKAKLEADIGRPVVTRVEIELLGWSAHQVALAPAADESCPHRAISRISAEMGDVMSAYIEGCRDGRFSPADAAIVAKELSDLAKAVEAGRLSSAALCARGGPADD
ncbi:hypothetical protein FG93_01962 [Bosea sp. LC85]|uniref:hypothetical protein n=1 Tax=Bosea sp. LC85 TaxID=1502851 RepID=UPI0004E41021|nr:hypothetical protein [Bosea sp. LC85]KFC73218.1 hypothetical protein FG93_01962 [Bosea sp. LC85]